MKTTMQGRILQALLALTSAAGAAMAQDDSACNGHVELCDKRYSEVSFAAAHNAAFVGTSPSHNQHEYPEGQFDRGVRVFTTQTHDKDGAIEQCHSDCLLLDVGPFSELLASLKGKLDASPREVATLLITNGADNIDIEKFGDAFVDAGLDGYVFQPDGDLGLADWPTLGQLIDAGTRLVVFMDYNADTSKVPYILEEFKYFFETPFSPTDDNFYQCDIDRPSDATADNMMIWVNHDLNDSIFGILVPAQDDAADTNSLDAITKQTDICQSNYGRVPNVVMYDFVDKGDVIAAQDKFNGF
ncbi:hypothetical protein SLS62_008441 [Diatrype stigma]|uniref:PLC-like phosphodiesterase n=1 Tax=Diatrype stigma TaxID=117547 RepID=A0AAN9UVV1_9PEZI